MSKVYMFLVALVFSASMLFSTLAEAQYYRHHGWRDGGYYHSGWRRGYWRRGIRCRWVPGYWARGYWHPGRRVCWRRW